LHERPRLCQAVAKVVLEHHKEVKVVFSFSCNDVRKHTRSNLISRSEYDKAAWKGFLEIGEKVPCPEYWIFYLTLEQEPPIVTASVNPNLLTKIQKRKYQMMWLWSFHCEEAGEQSHSLVLPFCKLP